MTALSMTWSQVTIEGRMDFVQPAERQRMEYETQVIQESCKDTELILRRYTFILHSGITACSLDSPAIHRRLSGHQHKVGGAGQCSFEELGKYCQGKDMDDLTPFFARSSFTCISWEHARPLSADRIRGAMSTLESARCKSQSV